MSRPTGNDGHRARKRFGQNFLHDRVVIERIVAAIRPQAGQALVEIGPGLGALTEPLLAAAGTLDVIEIDRDLVARLEARQLPGLTVHSMDVLTTDFNTLRPGEPLRIIGNLPYNISTPLLLRLLEYRARVQDVHVMLQQEVVDRLSAQVGTRAYGRLSVMLQSCFRVQSVLRVAPGAFSPAPKVQSAVVALYTRADAPDAGTIAALSNATRLAFANKRKTLRNNLKSKLTANDLEALGIDPGARAETLPPDTFLILAGALQSVENSAQK